jgi:hypothetical protein
MKIEEAESSMKTLWDQTLRTQNPGVEICLWILLDEGTVKRLVGTWETTRIKKHPIFGQMAKTFVRLCICLTELAVRVASELTNSWVGFVGYALSRVSRLGNVFSAVWSMVTFAL